MLFEFLEIASLAILWTHLHIKQSLILISNKESIITFMIYIYTWMSKQNN